MCLSQLRHLYCRDFTADVSGSINQFYTVLCGLWMPDKKRPALVYSMIADIIGVIIQQCANDPTVEAQSKGVAVLLPMAEASIRDLHRAVQVHSSADTQERGLDRFLMCAAFVGSHYPPFITSDIITKASQALHTAQGRILTRARTLEMVLRLCTTGVIGGRCEPLEIWAVLRPHAPSLLKAQVAGSRKSTSLQLLMINVLYSLSKYLTAGDVATLLSPGSIDSLPVLFRNHASTACREKYYDVLLEMWRAQVDGSSSSSASGRGTRESAVNLRELILTTFLEGLFDDSANVRGKVFTFLDSEAGLSEDPIRRFVDFVMKLTLPCASSLKALLHFTPSLLLALAKRSPDFTSLDKVFPRGLEVGDMSDFSDAFIDTTWTCGTSSVMRPLFASSQSGAGGYLRNTLDERGRDFSLTLASQRGGGTQQPGANHLVSSFVPDSGLVSKMLGNRDPYGANSMDQFMSQATAASGGGGGVSSATGWGVGAPTLSRATLSTTASMSATGSSMSGSLEAASPSQHLSLSATRTYRQPPRPTMIQSGDDDRPASNVEMLISRAMSRREARLPAALRTSMVQRMSARLTRKYRQGELPDVNIAVSSVIVPLLDLSTLDSSVASGLCTALLRHAVELISQPETIPHSPQSRRHGSSSSSSSSAPPPPSSAWMMSVTPLTHVGGGEGGHGAGGGGTPMTPLKAVAMAVKHIAAVTTTVAERDAAGATSGTMATVARLVLDLLGVVLLRHPGEARMLADATRAVGPIASLASGLSFYALAEPQGICLLEDSLLRDDPWAGLELDPFQARGRMIPAAAGAYGGSADAVYLSEDKASTLLRLSALYSSIGEGDSAACVLKYFSSFGPVDAACTTFISGDLKASVDQFTAILQSHVKETEGAEEDAPPRAEHGAVVDLCDLQRTQALVALQRWGDVEDCATSFARDRTPLLELNPTVTYRTTDPPITQDEFLSLDKSRRNMLVLALARKAAGEYHVGDDSGFEDDDAIALRELVMPRVGELLEVCDKPGGTDGEAVRDGSGIAAFGTQVQMALVRSNVRLLGGDLQAALTSCNDSIVSLPRLFASLPALATHARLRVLAAIQPLVELQDSLHLLVDNAAWRAVSGDPGHVSAVAGVARISTLFQAWRGTSPTGFPLNPHDALANSGAIFGGRRVVESHLTRLLQAFGATLGGDSPDLSFAYASGFALARGMYAQGFYEALECGELALAEKYMRLCYRFSKLCGKPTSSAQFRLPLLLGSRKAERLSRAQGTVNGIGGGGSGGLLASRERAAVLLSQNCKLVANAVGKIANELFVGQVVGACSDVVATMQSHEVSGSDARHAIITTFAYDHQFIQAEAFIEQATFLATSSFATTSPTAKRSGSGSSDTEPLHAAASEAERLLTACADLQVVLPIGGLGDGPHSLPTASTMVFVSPARSDASYRSSACCSFAHFADGMLRHVEGQQGGDAATATSASSSSKAATSAFEPASAERFAQLVVVNTLRSLAVVPGSTTSSQSLPLEQMGTALTVSGVFDGCGCPDPHGTQIMPTKVAAAVALLPRVLALAKRYPAALDSLRVAFGIDKPSRSLRVPIMPTVPIFTFLPWTPQLLALARPSDDAPNPRLSSALLHLLLRMADTYPQALFYPFHLSSAISPTELSAHAGFAAWQTSLAEFWAPLAHKLDFPLLHAFVKAMEDLHSPEFKFGDWVKNCRSALQSHKAATGKPMPRSLLRLWHLNLKERCFDDAQFGSHRVLPGEYIAKWRTEWEKKILAPMGSEGELITAEVLSGVARDNEDISPMKAQRQGSRLLPPPNSTHQLSAWLASFTAADVPSAVQLELPGQYARYDGSVPPDVSSHVCISAVSTSLTTMLSLRQPKKVTFVAQNERTYSFLVKGGEDIRIDQRIEQLFEMCNRLLSQGDVTRRVGYSLRTYAVVPLSLYIGMIEWVDNTATFKSLVEREATVRETATRLTATGSRHTGRGVAPGGASWTIPLSESYKIREDWLAKYNPRDTGNYTVKYKAMFARSPVGEVLDVWGKVMAKMPVDLLKTSIRRLAGGADAYIKVRTSFVNSFATFNVVGYLLGIGDRHLDNWLLDRSSGRIVPIDFGAAFGVATTSLAVPEMLPCRVSPQLLGVLQPQPAYALLSTHMTAVMACLRGRDASRQLLTAMEVFASEPTVDWLLAAQKRSAQPPAATKGEGGKAAGAAESSELVSSSSGSGIGRFVPAFRLLISKLKLQGVEPGIITLIELLQNPAYFPTNVAPSAFTGETRDIFRTVQDMLVNRTTTAGPSSASGGTGEADEQSDCQLPPADVAVLQAAGIMLEKGVRKGAATAKGHAMALRQCPTVDAQVFSILDLATDPNILCRLWVGLALWV